MDLIYALNIILFVVYHKSDVLCVLSSKNMILD